MDNEYDVIVIGSGGAGLSAAIEAKQKANKVLVVSKTTPTQSQTVQAQGGINAVIYDNKDSVDNHIFETYNSAQDLANKDNIRFLCERAKNTIFWLDKLGVPFSKTEKGEFAQRPFGGSKYIRTCYSSDYTGFKILHTLYDTCIKENIQFLNEYVLLDFECNNNNICNLVVFNLKTSEVVNLKAKSYVLATGGASNCFTGFTTNSVSTSADGLAIALKNGLELSNMEFIQFHPTALKRNNSLISESARAVGAYIVTKDEKRFIDELDTRDNVARAIKEKLLKKEEVFLDLRHLNESKLKVLIPQEIRLIKDMLGLDIKNDLIPINPAAHYCMGGIKTNVSCETSIKNLFVAGEVAQANIHGANRLGGNSLLEIIALGRIAGNNASKIKEIEKKAKNHKLEKLENEINSLLSNKKIVNIYKIRNELGKKMFENVGLFRDEKGLKEVINFLDIKDKEIENIGIKDKSKVYNKNILEYFELKNLILISKVITKSALKRKESRGSHYRIDFNKNNDLYSINSIIKMLDKQLIHKFEKVL